MTPGSYTELRFVLAGGCIQLADGSWNAVSPNADMPNGACMSAGGALRMPSMGQSGLKVTMSGDALNIAAGSKVLVVDFDVAGTYTAQLYPPAGTYTPAFVCSAATVAVTQNPTGPLTVSSGQASPITFTITSAAAK